MEINVTSFFTTAEPFEYSASVVERGTNAGPETWQNAKAKGALEPLLTTPEQFEALREHVRGFGAWDEDEIAAWDNDDCNALLIQMISADMREGDLDGTDPDWDAYEALCEAGQASGRIGRGDDGQVYYTLER